MTRRRDLVVLAAVVGLFGAGPTPGDIGGCGKAAEPLDAPAFAVARARLDCRRCGECGLSTSRCDRACRVPEGYVTFPATCQPLVFDGQVCLRALSAASCTAYEAYVADVARATPGECAFCRVPDDAGAP